MGNSSSHQPLERGFTRGTYGDVKSSKAASFRSSKRSPKKMDRLRKSFRDSFRRRKDQIPEASKPHMWQADEQAVRNATCAFPVKYMGCVEVFESRGMQVCEEAIKVLRNSRRRPIRGQLHVTGDGLRVVDDDTKGLLVDQTIEKVSFCAPDRSHERGFSYICRDGTTRRWMCHGFLAAKDSGERLSHAVGCAFAVCLERKQHRDKECGVTMTFDVKSSTFTRSGSFRAQTMTERLNENGNGHTPSAIVAPLQQKAYNPFAIERPHATPSLLERQGSFRGFSQIGAQSPFKRQMSLRISDLPSNTERQRNFMDTIPQRPSVSPIPEQPLPAVDTVSALCQELSAGLSLLTRSDTDDFTRITNGIINQSTAANVLNSPIKAPKLSPVDPPYTQMSVFNNHSSIPVGVVPPSEQSMLSNRIRGTSIIPSSYSPLTTIESPVSAYPPPIGTINSISASPQKIVPIETVAPLPKPEQWLKEIVKNTSPAPRRAPQMQNRAKSMSAADPFDTSNAEWAMPTKGPEIHATNPFTNPFISPPKVPAQSFQVQL